MNKVIDFYLRENFLSNSEENRFMANVMKKRTVEQEELVDIMVGETEKIPMGKINRVKGRTIICHLPDDLAAGNYRITVSLEGATGISQDSYHDFLTIA